MTERRTDRPARRLPRLALILALIAACASLVTVRPATGEPSGAFPNLDPWPDALALGGAPLALGSGIEAVLENPTGMLEDASTGIAFSHASLFTGGLVKHQTFAFCLARREERIQWQEGRIYHGSGDASSGIGIGATNLSGDLADSASYGELQIAISYARRVPLGLRAGVRIRFLQARTTVDAMGGGAGYALDFGLEERVAGWRIGVVGNALTSDVNWDRNEDGPIPARFALSAERSFKNGLTTIAGVDLRSTATPRRVTIGARYRVAGPLSLQAGPSFLSGDGESHAELSAGAAVAVGFLNAEYGMRTGPPGLGEIHRFGIRLDLPH